MKLFKSILAGLVLGTATLPALVYPAEAEITLVGAGIWVAREAAKMYWYDVGQYIQVCNSASRAREGQRVIREVREAVGEADIVRKSIRLAEWKNASSMQEKCFYGLTNDKQGQQLQRAVARLESVLREPKQTTHTVGLYKIRNRNYGKCLNLQPHENVNAGKASVWDCVTHPDQEWYLDNITHNAYKIRNKNHNKCLNLQVHEDRNNGQVSVWDCVTHRDQEWFLEGIGNSNLNRIFNSNYAMCLNLPSTENKNPGMAQVYDCVEHPDQQWYLEKID